MGIDIKKLRDLGKLTFPNGSSIIFKKEKKVDFTLSYKQEIQHLREDLRDARAEIEKLKAEIATNWETGQAIFEQQKEGVHVLQGELEFARETLALQDKANHLMQAKIDKYWSFVASVEVQAGTSKTIDALIRYADELVIRSVGNES